MTAKVTYNNKYLRPAPFVNIETNVERYDNGDISNVTYRINIDGWILANQGSPTSSGVFGDFGPEICENIPVTGWTNSILRKSCSIQDLFGEDYKELCLGNQGYSGNITAYPRLISYSLDTSDENAQYAKYSVELEADDLLCGGMSIRPSGSDSCIRSYDEDWEFSYDRTNTTSDLGYNRIFEISHNISANGRPQIVGGVVTKTAAQCAKEFVCERMSHGLGSPLPENCTLPSIYNASTKKRNYVDIHTVNELAGLYTVSESWIYTSGDTTNNYTLSLSTSESEGYDAVTIDGAITGYECRVSGYVTESAFTNAKLEWQSMTASSGFRNIAETVTGLTLDPQSESSTIGFNSFTGVIDYSYSYKERPVRLIPSAKFEKITPQNNWEEDLMTTVTILDQGELVQKLNNSSYKAPSTTLGIDVVYENGLVTHPYGPRFHSGLAAEIQSVVDTYHPSGFVVSGSGLFNNILVESQTEDWDRNTGAYSYSVTWKYNYASICS